MLKELEIHNFQSHKKSKLKFDNGVNVILGPTDSGKTAIIRALRWLMWNRPTGDSFCSTWGGDTKVTVLTDSHLIERVKGKENKYVLTGSEDTIEFKAIGTDVPEQVKQALDIDDINLQRQFDQPFLLSKTPGEIAVHFNKIAGINVIDTAIKNVQKEVRYYSQSVKQRRQDLKEKTKQLDQYDDIEEIETQIVYYKNLEKKKGVVEEQFLAISTICKKNDKIDIELSYEKTILKVDKKINNLLQQIKTLNELYAEKNKLKNLLGECSEINEFISKSKTITKIDISVNSLTNCLINLKLFKGQYSNLNTLIGKVTQLTQIMQETALKQAKTQALFNSKMPKICPLCGNNVKTVKV